MILYEIADKYVDIVTTVEYYKGRLFPETKESVFKALLAFTVIGGFISVAKISLYVWRIRLNCTDNVNESDEKSYDDFDLGMQSIKVILEAFPQSVISKFYFVYCDPAFDSFCGAPFIFFLFSLYCCYCRKHGPCIGCCDESGENEREWSMNICISLTAVFITFVISVMGLVFAILSLSEIPKKCP